MTTRRHAFSLAELLIVISIIVLMIALAVPAFNFITGAKSQSSANNQIASILGRARAEAIGLQEVRGVFFYLDPASSRYVATLVHAPGFSTWDNSVRYTIGQYVTNGGNYYACIQDNDGRIPAGNATDQYWKSTDQYAIDSILPDTDSITLPAGVGMQTVCDSRVITGNRTTDGYLSMGAILFDTYGRIVDQQISICYGGIVGQKMGLNPAVPKYTLKSMPPVLSPVVFESSFGYVLYDREAFLTQGFTEWDFYVQNPQQAPMSSYTGTPSERTEETWLDENAEAVLINRYNGSLIKSE